MTQALFLSPHNDDETLFGAFTILRETPQVITVFRSKLQEIRGTGIDYDQREHETRSALAVLGVPGWQQEQWGFHDNEHLSQDDLVATLEPYSATYTRVFAPQPYDEGGHPHHDLVGHAAIQAFGNDRVTLYHTYKNGRGRVEGDLVPIKNPDWIRSKLLALACYPSQIREPSTGHHFAEALHEYYG